MAMSDITTPTADVVILGAGAAGVAAAVVAARSGCRVSVIDNGPTPGGQYYRGAASVGAEQTSRPRDLSYAELRAEFDRLAGAGVIDYRSRRTAYAISRRDDDFVIRLRGDDRHRGDLEDVRARAVIVATGAFDRHLPFPGWDLPGVMSGGGAQSLVKGSGVIPGHRVVVAGTGPFLLAVSGTLLDHGAHVPAIIEANSPSHFITRASAVRGGLSKSGELLGYVSRLARHRVPYLHRHRVIEAIGVDRVEAVRIARVDADWHVVEGSDRVLECDAVAIGYGFVAQTDLAGQLGAEMRLGADGGLVVDVDPNLSTSVPGLFAAGETTGVGGVEAARVEGLLAGASVADYLGRPPALTRRGLDVVRRDIAKWRGFAEALHATFPVRDGWREQVRDDTLVCRCEEVRAVQVREAIDDLGARDTRAVKLFTRAGMGWCQGRICSSAVDSLCGFGTTQSLGGAAVRPLVVPVPLGALANDRMEG